MICTIKNNTFLESISLGNEVRKMEENKNNTEELVFCKKQISK